MYFSFNILWRNVAHCVSLMTGFSREGLDVGQAEVPRRDEEYTIGNGDGVRGTRGCFWYPGRCFSSGLLNTVESYR